MKYKILHEHYDTGKTVIRPYCYDLGKSEIPGSKIYEASLGDFMLAFVSHLTCPNITEDWDETTRLMVDLLNTNIRIKEDGNTVVSWIGPDKPSLCE